MELALGTAQFGLGYGIAGRGSPVPELEVRSILKRAAEFGIQTLDTAVAYGDIEARLTKLAPYGAFKIVTKLPAIPVETRPSEVSEWVDSILQRTDERIGDSLHAVLFHSAEDLLENFAEAIWARCAAWVSGREIKVGVSCYDTNTLNRVWERFPIEFAQLPGNALDQRLNSAVFVQPQELEVHIRSVFLQGLLLLPEAEAARRMPRATVALERWHSWLRERSLEPLEGALGLAKGFRAASHCVVGVDNLAQLEGIAEAWGAVPALNSDVLAEADLDIIDPRRWPRRK
jgi:aryl-alcohol dehydrogenase-like predicted oxidoreductase